MPTQRHAHTKGVVSFANVFVIENVVEMKHVKKTKRGKNV